MGGGRHLPCRRRGVSVYLPPWTALRTVVYAGRRGKHRWDPETPAAGGRLPPILPVVLYNGDRRWAAPLALHTIVRVNSPCGHGSLRYAIR